MLLSQMYAAIIAQYKHYSTDREAATVTFEPFIDNLKLKRGVALVERFLDILLAICKR